MEIPLSELLEDIDLQHVEDLASSAPGVRVVVDDSRGNKIAEFGKNPLFYDVIHSIDPSIKVFCLFQKKGKGPSTGGYYIYLSLLLPGGFCISAGIYWRAACGRMLCRAGKDRKE